ncbi:hypothetical protein GB937_007150 [Aspergillus fischeri]|nr:hypothetical protein GB937_007150 [Aspergillus fischeri]
MDVVPSPSRTHSFALIGPDAHTVVYVVRWGGTSDVDVDVDGGVIVLQITEKAIGIKEWCRYEYGNDVADR